jgi:hypothetical protein
MKYLLNSITFILVVLLPYSQTVLAEIDANEALLVEILNPYAKQLGLLGINLSKTDIFPDNYGSMEIRKQYLEIEVGTDVKKMHADLNEDAFSYVLCHELGHYFAGPPLKNDSSQLSSEGQSDYWASAVCLKKFFRRSPAKHKIKPLPFVKSHCDSQFQKSNDRIICYRSAQAGMDFMTEMHNWIKKMSPNDAKTFYGQPQFGNKELGFFNDYPSLQCRVETIAAGAFCNISENRWTQRIANWHCENSIAARPSCWFKK